MMRIWMALGCAAAALFIAGCSSSNSGNDNVIVLDGIEPAPHSAYFDYLGGLSYTVSRTVEVADTAAAKTALEKIIADNGGHYLAYTPDTVAFKVSKIEATQAVDAVEKLGKVTGRALETSDEYANKVSLLYSLPYNKRQYQFLAKTVSDRRLLVQIREASELLDLAEYNSNVKGNFELLANKLSGVTIQVTFTNPKQ